jgi:hypothetical protein
MDRADLNSLPGQLQAVKLGSAMQSQMNLPLYNQKPTASAVVLTATYDAIKLPAEAKASGIVMAYARKTGAAGTLGPLAVVAFSDNTHPADGEIAVGPNGDLLTLGTSQYTAIDLVYVPLRADVIQLVDCVVATNSFAIPSTYQALALLSVDASTGTSGGAKTVSAPSGSSAAAGTSRLDVAKNHVKFANADAITKATITLAVIPAVDVNAVLQGSGGV